EFCVVGYGWVGRGVARYAAGNGARATVVEIDPVKALEAYMDGHRVAGAEALADADVVVTTTGGVGVLGPDALALLKDGAILANAGHDDREIDVEALGPGEEVRPGVTRHELGGGRAVYLLVQGRLVNIAGADGHPVEIMDLSFSVQALAAHLHASTPLPPGAQPFPYELDRELACTKLDSLGITLPASTPDPAIT